MIDLTELAYAFGDQRVYAAHAWYLDRASGEIVLFTNETPDASRYLYVPPRPTRDVLACMRRFAETVEDWTLRAQLLAALVSRGPLRRFKDVLLEAPEIRARWLAFEQDEMHAYCKQWLSAHALTADL
jgi:hypothetical protein